MLKKVAKIRESNIHTFLEIGFKKIQGYFCTNPYFCAGFAMSIFAMYLVYRFAPSGSDIEKEAIDKAKKDLPQKDFNKIMNTPLTKPPYKECCDASPRAAA
jgi:hypothetical protein